MVWRWSPLAPIGEIKSGKKNTVKRYTPNSATPIVLKRQQNVLYEIQDGVPLKLKNNDQRPNTRAIPVA
jgi:hypothetical protein